MANDRNILSFGLTDKDLADVQNFADSLRIKLRKKGVKFSKQQLYLYFFITAMKYFVVEDFMQAVEEPVNK